MDTSYNGSPVRLDRYLRKHFPSAPLSLIYKWIRREVKVNNKKEGQNYRLKEGDHLVLAVTQEEERQYTQPVVEKRKTKETFAVLYEDPDLLVVNKPPYLASQPGQGVMKNNLVQQVKEYLRGIKTTIALANRLDRETSGIVIVGKNRPMNDLLYSMFKERRVEKYYVTLVVGRLPRKQGLLQHYLRRKTINFQHRMLISKKEDPQAVYAEAEYHVLKYYGNYTLIKVKLKTGRMHQIRVQMRELGYPVLGDRVYGNREENQKWKKILKRQFLHAAEVEFTHPLAKKRMKIEAPLPEDLSRVVEKIGFS